MRKLSTPSHTVDNGLVIVPSRQLEAQRLRKPLARSNTKGRFTHSSNNESRSLAISILREEFETGAFALIIPFISVSNNQISRLQVEVTTAC